MRKKEQKQENWINVCTYVNKNGTVNCMYIDSYSMKCESFEILIFLGRAQITVESDF